MSEQLTEYERERKQQIAHNEARLAALGIPNAVGKLAKHRVRKDKRARPCPPPATRTLRPRRSMQPATCTAAPAAPAARPTTSDPRKHTTWEEVFAAVGFDDPEQVEEELEKLKKHKLNMPFMIACCPALQTDDMLMNQVGLALPAYGALKQWLAEHQPAKATVPDAAASRSSDASEGSQSQERVPAESAGVRAPGKKRIPEGAAKFLGLKLALPIKKGQRWGTLKDGELVKELVETLCKTYKIDKERAEDAVKTKCRNLAKDTKPAASGKENTNAEQPEGRAP